MEVNNQNNLSRSQETSKSGKPEAKLDDAGFATKEKIVAFLDVHYQPVTKWESDQTFEEVLQKTLGRNINQQAPNQDTAHSTDVAKQHMVGG